MTIHKSSAVNSGVMPDSHLAGVVLCRTASFTTVDDSIVSGDTLQMVPIPEDGKILRIEVYYSALPAGTTNCDIGYGGDPDAFMAGVDMTAANVKVWPAGIGDNAFKSVAGFGHTFTADDTIDIAFTKLATKIPTSQNLKMSVFYKLVGNIADES